jgi:hypothetical protein
MGKDAKKRAGEVPPERRRELAKVAHLTGAKKVKKTCCRSMPRCKSCPVLLMRTARAVDAGLTGKDLKKAIKKARAA